MPVPEDLTFWPLWVLPTHGSQTYMQEKHPYTHKKINNNVSRGLIVNMNQFYLDQNMGKQIVAYT